MAKHRSIRRLPLWLLTIVALLSACGLDTTGAAGANGRGELVLAFSKASATTSQLSARVLATAGNVKLEQIEAITVTISAIEALHQSSGEDEAEWVTRQLSVPITLNLLALPVAPEDAVKATVEALDAGTYLNLRLHVSRATIRFSEDIGVGGGPVAKTYRTGVDHTIRIAGEPGERLLLPTARFEVLANDTNEIDIVFDEGTSVRSVVATPQFLLMAPVLIDATDRSSD